MGIKRKEGKAQTKTTVTQLKIKTAEHIDTKTKK